MTMSLATALVTLPNPLLTTTPYPPASPPSTLVRLNTAVRAPEILSPSTTGTPSLLHWKLNGTEPLAKTLNVAVVHATLVRLAG
jgi:hypothetical protein